MDEDLPAVAPIWSLSGAEERIHRQSKLDEVSEIINGQLYQYRFDRILRTLNQRFDGFKHALVEFVFDETKAEANNLSQQPLPSNFCQDDLDGFSYDFFHKKLGEEAPVLRAAITGSMATNNSFSEIEEPWRFPFGGSERTRKICLKSAVCQTMSMCHHVGHPRTRCLMACINTIYASLKHVNNDVIKFGNYHGLFVSKPSALKIIDNLTAGPNKIVLGWKSDMERVVSLPTLRLRRTLAAQEAPGFTFGVDNVGWSYKPRHVDKKGKKSEYKKMCIAIAIKNRIPTAHLPDDPDISLLQQLMEKNLFFPDTTELKILKSWIMYNIKDIATAHVSNLFRFRPSVRHPAVLYPKKMAQVSEVETMDLHLVDPATYEGVIEVGKSLTVAIPTIDQDTGRKAKILVHEDQGLEEKHFHVNFNLSGERDRIARCDGGIPMSQGFHREAVELKMHFEKFFDTAEKREPGSLTNMKATFHHNHASKDCSKIYDSFNLMESTTRSNLVCLIKTKLMEEAVETKDQFEIFMEKVFEELSDFGKFEAIHMRDKLLEEVINEEAGDIWWELGVEEGERMLEEVEDEELPDPELPESEAMEVDDTGEPAKPAEVEDTGEPAKDSTDDVEKEDEMLAKRKDMIFSGLVLLASKSSCRFGDGLAQTALWKYWLPDFWSSGHYKYAICSVRHTVAASGAMGKRVAEDVKHNSFVNTKGNHSAATLKRQARTLNMQKALEPKIFPMYIESGRSLAEHDYYGHGRADWTGQVEEAVELMEDYLVPKPGRTIKIGKETTEDGGQDDDLDEEEKTVAKKVTKKKARETAKAWSKEKKTFDEMKVHSFIKKHTKEAKRYIEAIYT